MEISLRLRIPVVLFVFFIVISSTLHAQYAVGVEGGGGYLINSVEGAEPIDRIAIPVFATFRYEAPFSMGSRTAPVEIGVQAGWMRLFTATEEFGGYEYTATAFTIPALGIGQISLGNWFVRLGAGIHYWNVRFDSDVSGFDASELNESGIDFAAMGGLGCSFGVSPNWNIDVSVQGYIVGYETDAAVNDANTVNAMVGVSYDF